MGASKEKERKQLKRRLRSLETQLTTLVAGHPTYTYERARVEREIQMVKTELRSKRPGRPSSKKKSSVVPTQGKKPPLPGGASFPSFQLPSPKSPTFLEDSIKSIGSLRNVCKQCMGYIQRADKWFDALHHVGSHLHETGVLPKITKGNFKELTTGDWTSILMLLLNSPLSSLLLGSSEGNSEPDTPAPATADAEAATLKKKDGSA
jgi:hypothetical protein